MIIVIMMLMIDDDDDNYEKVCVIEAPANEDNELDTLLLLGQVSHISYHSAINISIKIILIIIKISVMKVS